MAGPLRADAYLAAYASTDPPPPLIHATAAGRAPRAYCGAIVDRLAHDPRAGGDPTFDLAWSAGCADCVRAIIADLTGDSAEQRGLPPPVTWAP